jgi:transcription termination/antitermination protein NusA
MAAIAANRTELLQIADAVARDKSIDKSVVLHAMEEAMQRAAKARYGSENEIRVEIDPKTGETHVSRYLHVVELVDNDKIEISLEDARARNPAAQVGDIIAETLAAGRFLAHRRPGRQAGDRAEGARRRARAPIRRIQGSHRRNRHGIVKRVEFGSVVVDLGRAEGVVRRDEMIPRENFRTGDRIRAYIYDVRRESARARRFSSRAAIRSSWCGCSRRKCRKSMTASSKSAQSRAIRARAPRSP